MDQYRTETFDPARTRDYITTDDLKIPEKPEEPAQRSRRR